MATFFLVLGTICSTLFAVISLAPDFQSSAAAAQQRANIARVGIGCSALLIFIGTTLSTKSSEREDGERQVELLQAVWREAQQLSPTDLSVVVTIDPGIGDIEPPNKLNDEWVLTAKLVRPDKLPASFDPKLWSPHHLFGGSRWGMYTGIEVDAVTLTAMEQHARPRLDNVEGRTVHKTELIFGRLSGNLDQFVSAQEWNGTFLEVHLEARQAWTSLDEWAGEQDIAGTDFRWAEGVPDASLKEIYNFAALKEEQRDQSDFLGNWAKFYPVRVRADVYAGTRLVGKTTGRLSFSTNGQTDDDLAVVKFPVIHVADNAFPVFEKPRPSRGFTDWLVPSLGWFLSLCSISCALGWGWKWLH